MYLAAMVRPARRIALRRESDRLRRLPAPDTDGVSPDRLSPIRRPILIGISCAIVVWALAFYLTPRSHVLINSASLNVSITTAIFALRLITAGLLFAFPHSIHATRLRWIGAGLFIQCVASVAVIRGLARFDSGITAQQLTYGIVAISLCASAAVLVGVVPRHPRPISLRLGLIISAASVLVSAFITEISSSFPALSTSASNATASSPVQNLTLWHWFITATPIAIGIVTIGYVFRRFQQDALGDAIAIGMILQVGALFHYAIWPTTFIRALTSTNILRLTSVVVVATVAIVHLIRLARDRTRPVELAAIEVQPTTQPSALVLERSADLGALVAHELGSSIAAMKGLVEILSLPDLDSESHHQMLAAMRSEAQVLSMLVQDIRTLGSVDQHKLVVKPFPIDLGVIIGDAIGFARSLPGDHTFRWPDTLSAIVCADPERISQVFRNLLANAAKYTSPHDSIEVKVTRQASSVQIAVIDHRPGISPKNAERIFGLFDRGDSPPISVTGFGIGLFISRELVRLHGHDLHHEQTPGGGATFLFHLDIAR